MTVLFDLMATQPLAGYAFHGGAEYSKQVLQNVLQRGHRDFDAVYDPDRAFDPALRDLCDEHGVRLVPVGGWADAARAAREGGYRTFFSGLPYGYAGESTEGVRFVMAIHGLRGVEMPVDPTPAVLGPHWLLKGWHGMVNARRAERRINSAKAELAGLLVRDEAVMLTGSRHSKYSILSHFPFVDGRQVNVLQSPVDSMAGLVATQAATRGDYYLLLGGDRWVKNTLSACVAIDSLMSDGLLGSRRVTVLGVEDQQYFTRRLSNLNRFEFRGYVELPELASAIQGAYCLVFPSLNEGFGYPPLNAMELGTPVVASALSSIPEICGEAALYFDPCSLAEIRNRVLQIDDDGALYDSLVERGRQHYTRMKESEVDMVDRLVDLIFDNA